MSHQSELEFLLSCKEFTILNAVKGPYPLTARGFFSCDSSCILIGCPQNGNVSAEAS